MQAILRQPETAADAYIAMVEENEIRVGLSYYERARVAAKAVEQGVYSDEKQALLALFASASRAKRSKIRSFLTLYHAGEDLLRFPTAIGERLGLALAKALEADASRRDDLRDTLRAADAADAAAELACLDRALARFTAKPALNPGLETKEKTTETPAKAAASGFHRVVPGVDMAYGGRSVTLTGAGVTEAFRARLLEWIQANS